MWVLKEKDFAGKDMIVGCVGAKVARDTVTIGPLAVRPSYQVWEAKHIVVKYWEIICQIRISHLSM